MESFFPFIVALLITGAGILGLTLVLDTLFPAFVRRARTTAEQMPGRSAIVGFINFAFFTILGVVVLSMAQEAENSGITGAAVLLRLFGALELLALWTFIAFGIAALARWLGERILPSGSGARQIVGGIAALELAAIAPLVGWVLVPLAVVLVGYGSVVIALFWRRNAS